MDDVRQEQLRAAMSDLGSIRRSRTDRVAGGVCAGIGRHFGIDPVLIRVLIVVLTMFGTGAILYGLAWLFVPEDPPSADGDDSTAKHPLLTVIVGIIVTVAIVGIFIGPWDLGFPLIPLALVGGLIYLLVFRNRSTTGFVAPPMTAPAATPIRASHSEREEAARLIADQAAEGRLDPEEFEERTAAAFAARTVDDLRELLVDLPNSAAELDRFLATGARRNAAAAATMPEQRTPQRRRGTRGALFGITTAAAVLACGLLALVDIPLDVPDPLYPALALTIVAAGLVVGTWLGRSRALIAVGVVLAALLAIASLDVPVRAGEIRLAPTSAAALDDAYSLGAGRIEIDLTGIDPDGLDNTDLTLSVGTGEVLVIVPDDLAVSLDADIPGAGEIVFDGERAAGPNIELASSSDEAADLDLEIDVLLGRVEVRRG